MDVTGSKRCSRSVTLGLHDLRALRAAPGGLAFANRGAVLDVLLVEDDLDVRNALATALRDNGHFVVEAPDAEQAFAALRARSFDLALCDVQLPGKSGLDVLRHVKRDMPRMAVVVMTTFSDVRQVVGAMKDGAAEYVTKPFDPYHFVETMVASIAERVTHAKHFERARERQVDRLAGEHLVGSSAAMEGVRRRIELAAPVDAGVLVTGEPGSGKELVARRVHALSPRRERPFFTIEGETATEAEDPVGTGDEALLWEDLLRRADGGTVLVRHVDALSPRMQAALARALAFRETSAKPGRPAPRVIGTAAPDATLRADLQVYLGVLRIEVPPLRERGGDRAELVHHYLARHGRGVHPSRVSFAAMRALERYGFPGNVRELGAAIERAVAMAGGVEIAPQHLPEIIAAAATTS